MRQAYLFPLSIASSLAIPPQLNRLKEYIMWHPFQFKIFFQPFCHDAAKAASPQTILHQLF